MLLAFNSSRRGGGFHSPGQKRTARLRRSQRETGRGRASHPPPPRSPPGSPSKDNHVITGLLHATWVCRWLEGMGRPEAKSQTIERTKRGGNILQPRTQHSHSRYPVQATPAQHHLLGAQQCPPAPCQLPKGAQAFTYLFAAPGECHPQDRPLSCCPRPRRRAVGDSTPRRPSPAQPGPGNRRVAESSKTSCKGSRPRTLGQ